MTGTQRKGRTHSDVGRQVRVASDDDVKQLLEMAFGLHRAGELSRARGLYERIIEQQPGHADALHFLGLLCFQEGDSERALTLIRSAIEQKPQVASYHDNLGTVLETRGELEAALEAFGEAVRLAGDDPERSFNIGVVLGRLDRPAEAENAYRRAIELSPDDGGFHFNLATLLKGQGRLDEALTYYRKAITCAPQMADAHNNLGNTLQALGRLDEAAHAYTQAISLRPDDATTHVNLANVNRRRSALASAAAGYAQALSLNPALDDARLALGEVRRQQGELEAARETFLELLARQPDHGAALSGLAACLRFAPGEAYCAKLYTAILRCFDEPAVQVQDLAAAAAVQLRGRYALDDDCADVEALVAHLADDPLLVALLTRTINIDAVLERCLVKVRAHLALADASLPVASPHLRLATAIAAQCFVNQYVFTSSAREDAAQEKRRARLKDRIAAGGAPDDAMRAECALLAMSAPLLDVAGADRLGKYDAAAWGETLWPLIERTVCEPLAERALVDSIDTLGDCSDPVSQSVRDQYEQHPYPRWLELPRRNPVTYHAYLSRRFVHFAPPEWADGPVRVLVAGCGTGQEAAAIAMARGGAQVVGLDLSQRSLAYGRRMADKLGIDNLRFVVGDLLDSERLGERFDVIECTGVLHHMADPLVGWRALYTCLEPGGLMKIGLYSARARAGVQEARERIRAASLEPVDRDIRAFRAEVLAAPPDSPLAALARSEDLYTMSSCRDLLFHVEEHHFSLPAIADALDILGLEFIGFDLGIPGALEEYVRFNPDDPHGTDLAGWDRFEQGHPELFAALYVFWCRKRL